jgi:hypothetical protein
MAHLTEKGGSYLGTVLGTLPADLVGYYFGDPVRFKRAKRLMEMEAEIREHHERWGYKGTKENLSPSLGIPLLEAASDESRERLKELWSKLVAAAMDPERKNLVRGSVIEAVKRMDPLDAIVLERIESGSLGPANPANVLAQGLSVSQDEVVVSITNLQRLGLLMSPHGPESFDRLTLTSLARLLRSAVRG